MVESTPLVTPRCRTRVRIGTVPPAAYRVGEGGKMDSREALRGRHREQSDNDSGNGRRSPSRQPDGRRKHSLKKEFAPDDGRYVTLDEYWAKWYVNPYPDIDVSYEWNNGRLEAKPLPNKPQLNLYNWFLDLIRRYLETHAIADLINLETGFLLTISDPAEPSGQRAAVRKPDIGVILNSNPVSWGSSRPTSLRRCMRHGCRSAVRFHPGRG